MTLRRKHKKEMKKTCNKCGNTYPRTQEYFYAKKHGSLINSVEYYNECIECSNKRSRKWKDENKERRREADIKYKETKTGYFKELYSSIERSTHGNNFKSYEEFLDCWEKQKEIYGLNCPYYPSIQMTRIKGTGKATDTNISKDRILSSMPYGPKNIMFISWKANNEKGNVTPYLATRYLEFVNKSEYCRKITEFELTKLNNLHRRRFGDDIEIIAAIIEDAKHDVKLQHEYIEKMIELFKDERKDN